MICRLSMNCDPCTVNHDPFRIQVQSGCHNPEPESSGRPVLRYIWKAASMTHVTVTAFRKGCSRMETVGKRIQQTTYTIQCSKHPHLDLPNLKFLFWFTNGQSAHNFHYHSDSQDLCECYSIPSDSEQACWNWDQSIQKGLYRSTGAKQSLLPYHKTCFRNEKQRMGRGIQDGCRVLPRCALCYCCGRECLPWEWNGSSPWVLSEVSDTFRLS